MGSKTVNGADRATMHRVGAAWWPRAGQVPAGPGFAGDCPPPSSRFHPFGRYRAGPFGRTNEATTNGEKAVLLQEWTRRAAFGLAAGLAAIARAGAATESKEEKVMERVVGVGGFFFRAKDPKAIAKWYQDNLGIAPVPDSYGGEVWRTEAGVTVFAPFPKDTTYFGDAGQQWMINFRVRDLDKMAAQLKANGVAVEIDPQVYPNGRFAKVVDPEGNPIQLWQPEGKDPG